MAESTPARMPRALDSLNRLTPVQKIGVGAAALTLVAGLFLFTRSGNGAGMAAIYTDLEPRDAAAVTEQLAAQGVDYELADAGRTVLVPQNQVYDLRVSLSAEGLPTANEGYALLDEQGITTSEFRQRVDYQRALEGELARTLRSIDGVESAIVHLALPDDSVFVDEPENPTASVLVSTGGLSSLSSEQVAGMVHLVASSVKGMAPENVTIADATGAVLATGGETTAGAAPAGAGGGRIDAATAVEQDIANDIRTMLARVTGAGSVTVSVQAELDLTEKTAVRESFEDASETEQPLVIAERRDQETYTGASSTDGETGVLGPDGAPVEDDGTADTDSSTNYERDGSERTFALNRTVEEIRNAPGAVTRLNVAVLVDEASVTEEQLATVEQIVATAAGIDPTRGDQVTVSRLPFDTSAIEESEAAAEEAAAAVVAEERSSMIRTAVIAFVLLLAMLLAYRSTRRARREVSTPIDIGAIRAAQVEHDVVEPAALEESALPPMPAIDPVTAASKDALDELSVLADRKPEEVAQILQSWLSDERANT